MCQKTKHYRSLEVFVDNTMGGSINLPEDYLLRNVQKITAINVYKKSEISVSPIRRPLVNPALFAVSTLTLTTIAGDEVIHEIPLSEINRANNNGHLFEVDLPPLNITNCKINIADTTTIVAGESYLIGFYFENAKTCK